MKKIILINGMARSGKDETIKLVSEIIPTMSISSVDKIKEAAKILGWDGGKTEADRLFLADMGYLQTRYNNGRYKYVCEKIEEFEKSESEILFVHTREGWLLDKIKNNFNATTLFIMNLNVPDITSNDADKHVYDYEYDYTIDNSGSLLDLAKEATRFVNWLKTLDH